MTFGGTRDLMMAHHQANHIQVAYAENAASADLADYTKASLAAELGIEVSSAAPRRTDLAFSAYKSPGWQGRGQRERMCNFGAIETLTQSSAGMFGLVRIIAE